MLRIDRFTAMEIVREGSAGPFVLLFLHTTDDKTGAPLEFPYFVFQNKETKRHYRVTVLRNDDPNSDGVTFPEDLRFYDAFDLEE